MIRDEFCGKRLRTMLEDGIALRRGTQEKRQSANASKLVGCCSARLLSEKYEAGFA